MERRISRLFCDCGRDGRELFREAFAVIAAKAFLIFQNFKKFLQKSAIIRGEDTTIIKKVYFKEEEVSQDAKAAVCDSNAGFADAERM